MCVGEGGIFDAKENAGAEELEGVEVKGSAVDDSVVKEEDCVFSGGLILAANEKGEKDCKLFGEEELEAASGRPCDENEKE